MVPQIQCLMQWGCCFLYEAYQRDLLFEGGQRKILVQGYL